jgi:tetratricopeptide (TPR) repeat protein
MLAYWDTVEDRLIKIRHSLDIRGRKRSTFPLGADLAEATIAEQSAADLPGAAAAPDFLPLPAYRFQFMVQKANEFAGDVKALGGALLAAIEKRDAEALAALRSGHEIQTLMAAEQIRRLQIEESSRSLEGLRQSRAGAVLRRDYYTSRLFLSAAETVKEALTIVSSGLQLASGVQELAAAVLHALPDVSVGAGGHGNSPNADVKYGASQLGNAVSAVSRAFSLMASMAQTGASMAGTMASYERRKEEWDHQAQLAENDIAQFDFQIAAAESRQAIVRRELENHLKQVANAREVAAYMREKFSNVDLYEWMVDQASAAHFQSYMLACDLARKAQACYRYERADAAARFIRVERPDSMRGALMSGERLQQDLRRMDASYMATNAREFELTRHVSLAQLDPVALLLLQQNGECYFHLPEALFDADQPGQYLRRIKSVSLSIPCVVGPYTGVNCRLTLETSEIRVKSDAPVSPRTYARSRGAVAPDDRFVDVADDAFLKLPSGATAIVTSSAQNDSGVFELRLSDERYLPFEGAGAISSWHMELPKGSNRFDFGSIADVIVHVRYTARDGTPELRQAAETALGGATQPAGGTLQDLGPLSAFTVPRENPLAATRLPVRMFSARREFPDAWHRFLNPSADRQDLVLALDLAEQRFPYHPIDQMVSIEEICIVVVTPSRSGADGFSSRLACLPVGTAALPAVPGTARFASDPGGAAFASCTYKPAAGSATGAWEWRIAADQNPAPHAGILDTPSPGGALRIRAGGVTDLLVFCSYAIRART